MDESSTVSWATCSDLSSHKLTIKLSASSLINGHPHSLLWLLPVDKGLIFALCGVHLRLLVGPQTVALLPFFAQFLERDVTRACRSRPNMTPLTFCQAMGTRFANASPILCRLSVQVTMTLILSHSLAFFRIHESRLSTICH